jgi:hypothetical protein
MTRLRQERYVREIDASSDIWRAMAREVPRWELRSAGASTELWNPRDNALMGTLDGASAHAVARYLNAINPDAGLSLAELLWLIGGHGTMANVQRQAHSLLKSMNIDGVT